MGQIHSDLTTSLHHLTDRARDSSAAWRKIKRIEKEEQRIYDAKQSDSRRQQRVRGYDSVCCVIQGEKVN